MKFFSAVVVIATALFVLGVTDTDARVLSGNMLNRALGLDGTTDGTVIRSSRLDSRKGVYERTQVEMHMKNKVKVNELLVGEPPSPSEAWFEAQRVDHFGDPLGRKGVWRQRYFYANDYHRSPGCVLLIIGGEGPLASGYLTSTMFPVYAKEHGCAMFALEHRFYGQSYPTQDTSLDSLQLLSSQQALADLAYFAEEVIKEGFSYLSDPIIVVGGSYSGALASWAREKYPSLFFGALASSAPVDAVQDFSAYLDVVENSITNEGTSACMSKIFYAISELSSQSSTASGLSKIASDYSLCAPISGSLDLATFFSSVIGSFQGVVQYNSPDRAPANIASVCTVFSDPSKQPSQALVNVTLTLNPLSGSGCLDTSYVNMISELNNTVPGPAVGGRAWLWQTASQFGYYQTTDQKTGKWGTELPLSYSTKMIDDLYTIDGSENEHAIEWTNAYYGAKTPKSVGRIAFINGLVDPWHALSILDVPADSGNTAIVIPSGSHCQDWTPGTAADMIKAQKAISQLVGEWVATAAKGARSSSRKKISF